MIPGKCHRLAGCADDRHECLVLRWINHRRGYASESPFMREHPVTDVNILDRRPPLICQHAALR
jgi:hypothetical protein